MLKVTRPRFRPRFPDRSFAPGLLFGSGIQGVWYDPSDFGTMFQDVAGTTPVTAVGQSVALIRDKSGNGNHATQSVLASMPTLSVDAGGRYFLLFDGSNDSMLTSSVDFSATNAMTVWVGMTKLSDATWGLVVENSAAAGANNGTFGVFAPYDNTNQNYGASSRGTTTVLISGPASGAGSVPAPSTDVLTLQTNIATPSVALRRNGAAYVSSTSSQGTGNFGNYPLYIGRRNNSIRPLNGRIYSLIVRGAASTPAQIAKTEAWVNGKTGAY